MEYFVSPKGRDSNRGTLMSPWKTLGKALRSIRPGDTVYLRNGVYSERVDIEVSGTPRGPITIANYRNEPVTFDGKRIDWGYDWGSLFDLNGQSHLKIKGLRVINSRWAGIGSTPDEDGCQNVTIEGCSTYNTQSSGITFHHAKNIIVAKNIVEKACVKTNGSQEGISLSTVDGFKISGNRVFNITNSVQGGGGEAIDAKNGCINGEISGNTVYAIAKIGIYLDSYERYQHNIKVYGNTVYDCEQGITIASENGGLLEDIFITDNDVRSCGWGMAVGGWDEGYTHEMRDITFSNNRVDNSKLVGMYLGNNEVHNVLIQGNRFNSPQGVPMMVARGIGHSKYSIMNNTINGAVVSGFRSK